jgi:flagellar FliJ protein
LKRFKFNLEKILRLRSWKENEAKTELGRAVSALNKLENDLDNVAEQVQKTNMQLSDFLKSAETDTLNNTFNIYDRYSQYLESEKSRLLDAAAKAEAELEIKSEEWREAKAELKVMENLKENRFKEYKKNISNEDNS